MTHEEHIARAMLMGREYDWRDGTYMVNGSTKGLIDAITLEPISSDDAFARAVAQYEHTSLLDKSEYNLVKRAGKLSWESD